MMHFAWFPEDGAFNEWIREPRAYYVSRKYQMKERVEKELPERLGLEAPAYMPFKELFRTFSNTSVHPTRDSAERAWGDAAWRTRCELPPYMEEKMKVRRFNAFAFRLVLFLSQLHLFLRFLRLEVLGKRDIPLRYRQSRPTVLEHVLGIFLSVFAAHFKAIIDQAKREVEASGAQFDED